MTSYASLRLPLVAGITAVMLAACSDGFTAADATNNDAVFAGQQIYADNCASCHGAALQGQPNWRSENPDGTMPAPPHNDNGHTWHHADELLFNYTKLGGQALAPEGFKSAMPGFADTLTDSDIYAVLSFIKSRWSIEAQMRQARLNK